MDAAALYRLMTWLSPSFPVGAYSYSHGIEYAVEAGLVHDRASLTGWVAAIVGHGAGQVDAVLFRATYDAVAAADETRLADILELAAAFRATAETALESRAQGAAFLATCRAAWPHPALDRLARLADGVPVAMPVAVATACAAADTDRPAVPLDAALTAFLQAVVANLVSAGVRLIPLGQTEGQQAIAALETPVAAAVKRALATPLDDIGSAAPMVDWTSMLHETQYTRLFRS